VVVALGCVLEGEGEAAGEDTGAGELQVSSGTLIYCTKKQTRGITRCARRREGRSEGGGGAGFTDGVGIGQRCLQGGGASARNFSTASRCFRERAKRDERGV
jgi:hypothetical protein